MEQVSNLIVTNFLSAHQWAPGTEPRCSQTLNFSCTGSFCCWETVRFYLITPILSQFSSVHLLWCIIRYTVMISLLLYLFFISSQVIYMQRVLPYSFLLRALSNQLLCIICLKETGSIPSAWCYPTADMAGLAPSLLLWHGSPSVELKAASRPFRSPIIDREWQWVCTALNSIYVC